MTAFGATTPSRRGSAKDRNPPTQSHHLDQPIGVLTPAVQRLRASRRYCTWLQATQWLGRNSRNSGRTRWHSATASGQRGWKTQPGGGLIGLGTSPTTGRNARLASTVGSGTGTAARSAVV